ncbi:MAG: RNA-splicing ligase RtcB [Candidatus Coatesbacteria bacterium]|nr:RNA-splicing ligase RtcB [Candidatus Coatesbacteria bacterium]
MGLPRNVSRMRDYSYRVEEGYVPGMRRTARVFTTEQGLTKAHEDGSLRQLAEVACLPGGVGEALALPDIHHGYGFPIGGVAAFDAGAGLISPGGVGYDINCGVRALATPLTARDVRERADEVADLLFTAVPCGVGASTPRQLGRRDLRKVLYQGARWMIERGHGLSGDLAACESGGVLDEADPEAVSDKALQRGRNQLGTLGSGNHFLELQRVAALYDDEVAAVWGLTEVDQVVVMIHCGSRGLGHQVCQDTLKRLGAKAAEAPNRQLVYAELASPAGRAYLGAMSAAANYAWANRQRITAAVRGVLSRVYGSGDARFPLIYDVAHNIAKLEEHEVDGRRRRLIVHRKGATRAFPAGHPELPRRLREHGQPVILPGDMGTASYLLTPLPTVMERSFGSTGHGAGRVLSRKAAVRRLKGRDLRREWRERGLTVRWEGRTTLAEEHPSAYKDVDEVVRVCEGAGLARPVVRLEPLLVVKG